ncbi:MAG: (2Fe-2S)-binding protein [Betaproteobacteria bacterium]|nr:(2Fe-2S)-binding protein [Betaproteobacteria bacterium]
MTSEKTKIRLTVNGKAVEGAVEPRISLADFLREDLRLTGTHLGCEHGVCGACTILVDGDAMRSCLMFAVQADGASVTTVEGITPQAGLSPLQAAFKRHHALQCGFCTSGILMSATALLRRCAKPTPDEVRDALSGNLCRCTGYISIVDAVVEAGQLS